MISDGSLLIRDGIIEEVGSSRRVENLAAARGAVEISAAGRVVMPGFVDSHTHLMFPPMGASLLDMEDAVRMVRTSTGQRLQVRTQAHLETMARHGTTTVEAKTGCGPDECAETKLLRVLMAVKDAPLHVVPTFFFRLPQPGLPGADGLEAAVDWIVSEFLPKMHRRRFARFGDMAWDSDPARQGFFARYLQAARRLGLPCKIHADGSDAAAAIAMAVRNFVVSIDHLEYATPADVAPLADSSTMATLLPCAPFYNDGRNAPARAMIDAGVAVALATNFNPHHTPVLNMQTAVALACMQLKMTPEEAISAATINGAHALGRAERVGSLELGKAADLIILNTSDYRDLTYNFGMNLVHMTMKRGEFIYKEGDVAPRAAEDLSLTPAWG